MNNSTIFTHFYFIKYVFVLVFKKIPLYRGFPLNLLTLNRGPTVLDDFLVVKVCKVEQTQNSCLTQLYYYSWFCKCESLVKKQITLEEVLMKN